MFDHIIMDRIIQAKEDERTGVMDGSGCTSKAVVLSIKAANNLNNRVLSRPGTAQKLYVMAEHIFERREMKRAKEHIEREMHLSRYLLLDFGILCSAVCVVSNRNSICASNVHRVDSFLLYALNN